MVRSPAAPDFDTSNLTPAVRRALLHKENGHCLRCGLFQDFAVVGDAEIAAINALGKDELTNDPTFGSYPPPDHAVISFNERYFSRRTRRWADYLDEQEIVIRDALFLRSWFGAAPAFVRSRYGATVSGLDMSPLCERYTAENVPGYLPLRGEINGRFDGNLLVGGSFDAIFVFHVLCHSFDVVKGLRQIHDALRPGGLAIFSHEVVRKPTNPFHRVHPSEPQFLGLLRGVFSRADRIDDCEDGFSAAVNPYTLKGDVADFAAWRS
jgi:SAM-dependent methyltransferase